MMEDCDPAADAIVAGTSQQQEGASVAADPESSVAMADADEPSSPTTQKITSETESMNLASHARSSPDFELPATFTTWLPEAVTKQLPQLSVLIGKDSMRAVNLLAEFAAHCAGESAPVSAAKCAALFEFGWSEEERHGPTSCAMQAYCAAACLQYAPAWAAIGFFIVQQVGCPVAALAAFREAAHLGDVHAMHNAGCTALRLAACNWNQEAHDWLWAAAEAGDRDSRLLLGRICAHHEARPFWSAERSAEAQVLAQWLQSEHESNGTCETACALIECAECVHDQLSAAVSALPSLATPLPVYELAAEDGSPRHTCNLAVVLLQGEHGATEAVSARAVALLRQAAEAGSAAAASNLGACYEHGSCVETDLRESERWYQCAQQLGDEDAPSDLLRVQAQLAQAAVRSSPEAADALYERGAACWAEHDHSQFHHSTLAQSLDDLLGAAELGHGEAAMLAVHALEISGDVRNTDAKREELLRIAAANQVDGAAVYLAAMLEAGAGDEDALREAAHWYKVGAENGSVQGMFRLGVLLEDAQSSSAAVKHEAVLWYRRAAEAGHASAQLCLGVMYEQGTGGVKQDYAAAVHWYEAAAQQGSAAAAFNVGRLYDCGALGAPDEATAIEWYMQAGNAGDAEASFRVYELATLQEEEPSVQEMAEAWLQQAADQGSQDAQEVLRLRQVLRDVQPSEQAPPAQSSGAAFDSRSPEEEMPFQGVAPPQLPITTHHAPTSGPSGAAKLMRRMSLSKSLSREAWGALQQHSEAAQHALSRSNKGATQRELSEPLSVDGVSTTPKQDVTPEDDDAAAFRSAKTAAGRGDVEAQAAVAAMYYSGVGTAQDYVAARAWGSQAADDGVPSAQNLMARIFLHGHGVSRSERKARAWLEKAADQGHNKSQVQLAELLLQDKSTASTSRAQELLETAAANGNGDASHRLGTLMLELAQEGATSPEQAVEHLRAAANSGVPDAMCDLAMMYLQGVGIPQDVVTAKEWLKQAAKAGSPTAQNNLGLLYAFGSSLLPDSGLKVNAEKAYRWFRQAAEAGEAGAQFNLGITYLEGKHIQQDNKRAVKWLKRSADQQYPDAMLQLRNMYMNGAGVKRSRKKAIALQEQLIALGMRPGDIERGTDETTNTEPQSSTTHASDAVASPLKKASSDDKLYQAAARGDGDALFELSLKAADTRSAEGIAESQELMRMAARAGHHEAQAAVADFERQSLLKRAAKIQPRALTPAQQRHEFLKRAAAGK